jgi:hypothetical protein
MALIAALRALPVATAIRPTILRLVSKRLRTDTHTQQTDTGQTPDA